MAKKEREKSEFPIFKIYERKIKSPFIIHAEFEAILVSENNEKPNPEESYTNTYQKKLLVVMNMNQYVLVISFVSLLKHTQVKIQFTISLIHSMIEESKYFSDVTKTF